MDKLFLIGSDPEFNIVDSENNLKSAVSLLPGTKEVPHGLGNETSVQVDNVMAEFCVPATSDPDEFMKNLKFAMEEAQKMLPQGYSFKAFPSAIYPDAELDTPQAKEFGCEPDYTPYILDSDGSKVMYIIGENVGYNVNTKPTSKNPNLRSCGGHIHVDLTSLTSRPIYNNSILNNRVLKDFVYLMDIFLGVPSLLLDTDKRRRELYGKAGAYRPKPYGLEYRVLSNFWLEKDTYVYWVFDVIDKLITLWEDNYSYLHRRVRSTFDVNNVVSTINTGDSKQALILLPLIEELVGVKTPIITTVEITK